MLMNLDFISFITFNIWFMLTFKPTQIRSRILTQDEVVCPSMTSILPVDPVLVTFTELQGPLRGQTNSDSERLECA